MPIFSKTVYIEVEAENDDDANEYVAYITEPLGALKNVLYVDVEGPIEDVTDRDA